MKILKFNENNIIDNIEIDDYVIMYRPYHPGLSKNQKTIFDNFLENNIGIITNINKVHGYITVKYYNIPYTIRFIFTKSQYLFKPEAIKYYDKDIEILKTKIAADKYNL